MCGHVGMAGNLTYQTNKMFKDMLIFDQVRGGHSTGVFAIKNINNEHLLEKAVGAPNNLWDWGTSKVFDGDGDPKGYYNLLMGHNRHATSGKIDEKNCHPFEYDNLVGAHNGSLTNYHDLDGDHDMIDSQRMFQHINNKGITDAWKNFHGAAALVWYDKGDKTINFIRNKERPLFYVYDKDKKVVFWASELWMITVAASRRNITLERNDAGIVSHSFAEHEHYKFKFTPTTVELLSREKKEEKVREVFTQSSYGGYYGGYGRSNWDQWERHFKERQEKVEIKPAASTTTLGPPKGKQADWAKGTQKAEKTTRDLEFVIVGRGSSTYDYLIGSFLDEDDEKVAKPYLEIIPRDKEEYEKLQQHLYSDTVFRTKARCRAAPDKDGKVSKLRISAQHIELTGMMIDTSGNKTDKEQSNIITLYRTFGNKRVTEEQFREDLSKCQGGSTCYACGTDLDISKHEQFMWLDKDMCICQDCSSDRLVAAGMQ